MANRVLAGNRSTGGYGLYVSKANSNVLTCDRKELLFDSSQKRAGEVYAVIEIGRASCRERV